MELDLLLADAAGQRASDIHFVAGEPPIFRVNGKLERQPLLPSLTSSEIVSLLQPNFSEAVRVGLENGDLSKAKATLTAATVPEFSFPLTLYRAEGGGFGATINLLSGVIPKLPEIAGEATAILEEIATLPRGLVLFSGPIGSGKGTTSAAVVDTINRTRCKRIFIVGETSGYFWRSAKSIVTTLVVGRDYDTYEAAAEAVFGGADPDVVFFADLPTPEAALLALILADTGHLVIATTSADSAALAVAALVRSFPAESREHAQDLLARTLVAAINQRLLVRANGRGRIPAYETLFATPEIRSIIRVGTSPTDLQATMEQASDARTRTLTSAIDALVAAGEVTEEVASQHRPAR